MTNTTMERPIYRLVRMYAAVVLFAAFDALAQSYPVRPITIVVPYGPGSGIDIIAREIAQQLTASLGQSVIIENRAGASGKIGQDFAALAKPDGYTLLITSSSGIVTQITAPPRSNLQKDFDAVALTGTVPYVLGVPNDFPAKSLKELVEGARKRPGEYNYSSIGGGLPQFLGEMLKSTASVNIVAVPYKSTTDAQVDMLAGRVHVWFTTLASAVPVVKDGRVRILGVTGAQRNSLLPEVPTMAEAGYPDLDMDASFYILLPAGVPQAILNRLSADILHAQDSKAVKDRFAFQGIVSRTGSPVETRRALNNEFDKMNKIIKALSAKPS